MSKPTDDLESRLRALATKFKQYDPSLEGLDLSGLLRTAAAIGDEIGYARGVADAAKTAEDLSPDNCMSPAAQPYWQGYDMAAHDAAAAIRALAAQRTDGEVG